MLRLEWNKIWDEKEEKKIKKIEMGAKVVWDEKKNCLGEFEEIFWIFQGYFDIFNLAPTSQLDSKSSPMKISQI